MTKWAGEKALTMAATASPYRIEIRVAQKRREAPLLGRQDGGGLNRRHW